jgi:hypothetical protein
MPNVLPRKYASFHQKTPIGALVHAGPVAGWGTRGRIYEPPCTSACFDRLPPLRLSPACVRDPVERIAWAAARCWPPICDRALLPGTSYGLVVRDEAEVRTES